MTVRLNTKDTKLFREAQREILAFRNLRPSIPAHRAAEVTFDSEPEARRRLLNSDWCGLCEKAAFKTKTEARSYIGLLLSKRGRLAGPKDFLIVPYRCPHKKGWHIGHDPVVKKLLERRKR